MFFNENLPKLLAEDPRMLGGAVLIFAPPGKIYLNGLG